MRPRAQFQAPIQRARRILPTYWLQLAAFYRHAGPLRRNAESGADRRWRSRKPAESYFDAAKELYQGGRDFPEAAQYLQQYLSSGELVEDAPAFRAHYLLGQIYEKMGSSAAAAARISKPHWRWPPASTPPGKLLSHVSNRMASCHGECRAGCTQNPGVPN